MPNYPVKDGTGATLLTGANDGHGGRVAARARSANDAALLNGDVADLIATLVGALVVQPFAIPEATWSATGTLTTLADLVLKAAGAAGIRNYVSALTFQNNNATATLVVVKDGAVEIFRVNCPANMALPIVVPLPIPLRGSAATALNVAALTTGASVVVNAQGYVAP